MINTSKLIQNIILFVIFSNSTIGFIEDLSNELVKSSYIKLFLIFIIYLFCILLLYRNNFLSIKINKINKYINIFFVYIIINYSILLIVSFFENNYEYQMKNFFTYLFYWFFWWIIFMNNIKVDRDKLYENIRKILYFSAGIAYIVATLEILTKGINNFIYYNSSYRVSSYFDSGYAFGMFISIVYAISLSRIFFYEKNNIIDKLIFLLSLIFSYTTFTRNIYLVISFITISLLVMKINSKYTKKKYILKKLPYIYFFIALLFIINNFSMKISSYSSTDITNITSMNLRFNTWNNVINEYFTDNSLLRILFGNGLVQTNTSELVLDNSFLGIYVYQGIIILLIFLIVYAKIWRVYCSKINEFKEYEKAYMANFSVFLASSLFNNYMYGDYYFILGIFLISKLRFSDVKMI